MQNKVFEWPWMRRSSAVLSLSLLLELSLNSWLGLLFTIGSHSAFLQETHNCALHSCAMPKRESLLSQPYITQGKYYLFYLDFLPLCLKAVAFLLDLLRIYLCARLIASSEWVNERERERWIKLQELRYPVYQGGQSYMFLGQMAVTHIISIQICMGFLYTVHPNTQVCQCCR